MVTTNCSTDFDFKAMSLRNSDKPEDLKLYNEVKHLVDTLVAKLVPIISYIDRPIGLARGVVVIDRYGPVEKLCLGRKGDWFSSDKREEKDFVDPDGWENHTLYEVLENLNRVLAEASEKKRENQASVQKRSDMVAQMLKVLNSAE